MADITCRVDVEHPVWFGEPVAVGEALEDDELDDLAEALSGFGATQISAVGAAVSEGADVGREVRGDCVVLRPHFR